MTDGGPGPEATTLPPLPTAFGDTRESCHLVAARVLAAARYAAVGLLGVTLLKLFLHDLAQLGQLYRIGAFIGVAIIAMLASFAYQRFFAASIQPKEKIETVP